MADNTPEMIRLDASHNTNWRIDAGPVAVLNPASTLHDRIAYCWGLAAQLHDLSQFLNESDTPEVRRVSSTFFCQLVPLVAVLERLGSDTNQMGRV